MLREDPAYAEKAARIAALARDVTEVVESLGLRTPPTPLPRDTARRLSFRLLDAARPTDPRGPKALLAAAGFEPLDVPEGHLCCGSAGTYNLLQPEIAATLRERKLANIAATRAGSRRDRQYRLHHPARRQLRRAGRAYRRAPRLGHRRAAAQSTASRSSRPPAGIGGDQQRSAKSAASRSMSAPASRRRRAATVPRPHRARHRRSSAATGRSAIRRRRRRAAARVSPSA